MKELIEHGDVEKTEKEGEQLTHNPLKYNWCIEEDSEQDSLPLEIVNLSQLKPLGILLSFEEAGTRIWLGGEYVEY